MAKASTVTINILGDASGARKAFDDVQEAGSRLGSGMAKIGKAIGAGVALGAGAAAVGVGALVADGAKALVNLERIGAQTSAVIKSTGGAAKVSAEDVGRLADSIEKATGIETEAVREGQNLLLTFTNIQNRAGKGNDIFNQSTKILTDMSVALGTDVKSSAIQLGKALNDPVAGVTALTRVGVSFTDQQKEQIKAMTEAGDVAGAQKIILAELNKEFGGSAEAFGDTAAGRMAKFKNAIGDIGETMATALLPIAERVAAFFANNVLPAFQRLADAVGPFFSSAVAKVTEVFGSFIYTLRSGFSEEDTVTPIERVAFVVRGLAEWVSGSLLPALQRAAEFIGGQLKAAWDGIASTFNENREQLMAVVGAIQTVVAIAAPLLVGVLGVALRGVGVAINLVLVAISGVVRGITWLAETAGWLSVVLPEHFSRWVNWLTGLPGRLWNSFLHFFDGLYEGFKYAVNRIIRLWNDLELRLPEVDTKIPGIGKVGGFALRTPDIPYLAQGGIVTRPTLAVVGEAGPEAVVPLSRSGGMGQTVINLTINGPVGDRATADWIVERLESALARGQRPGDGRGRYLSLTS